MKVNDVMKRFPVTADVTDTLRQGAQRLVWSGGRHLPVMEGDRLVGIVTARDLAVAHAEAGNLAARLSEVMVAPVHTCGPEDSITEVMGRMATAKIGCLPVTEQGHLIGLLTVTDILFAQVKAAMTPLGSGPTAADVMTEHPATVHADDRLLDAAARMQVLRVRHLPVTDGRGALIGMLSDRDIRNSVGDPRRALTGEVPVEIEEMRVQDAMTRDPITVDRDRPCNDIAHIFADLAVGAVPVVDDHRRPVGIVSYVDVLRAYAARSA